MPAPEMTRRGFLQVSAAGAAAAAVPAGAPPAADVGTAPDATPSCQGNESETAETGPAARPFLTPAEQFGDVSRGNPKPHTLTGQALLDARLTAETWRLEITADPFLEAPHTPARASLERPRTLAEGNALDLPALMELGRAHEVHYFKAMQCLNIATPLGQGLWTGVPLRTVLEQCGKMQNVRRIHYWGFHNNDPAQLFKSSVSYTQCMETPPGELPVFLAYKLNGRPIPLVRGGPVRMVVPWSHGYKSIKWLQQIAVTNDARNNDTYAQGNNDPDSTLKTAAYLDEVPTKLDPGSPLRLSGQVICGPSGVHRVECWVRRLDGEPRPLADDDPELLRGPWIPCELAPPPDWDSLLPEGIAPTQLLGFRRDTGQPLSWPLKFGTCSFSAVVRDLTAGHYEVRARVIDLNGFAQPEPRPAQKNGRNALLVRKFEVA